MASGFVFVQGNCQAQSDAGQSDEIVCGFNLYKLVRPHDEWRTGWRRPGACIKAQYLCPPRPPYQFQTMFPTFAPSLVKADFLMMAIAAGERLSIDIDQSFWVRKSPAIPIGRYRAIAQPRSMMRGL